MRSRYTLPLLAVACQRADDRREEPRDPEPLRVVVNGHAMVPRTVLAATRGGETVYLALSSAANRTCDQLFGEGGVQLGSRESLVSLDLARPPLEHRKDAPSVPSMHPHWQVLRATWPDGSSGALDAHLEPIESTIRMADDLATRGGQLALRYTVASPANARSRDESIAIDGTTTVQPCGDRRPVTVPAQLEARIGARTFRIRGALVISDDSGWRLTLATMPLRCPTHDVWDAPGDLGVDVITRGGERSIGVFGDVLVSNLSLPGDGVSVQPDGPIDGRGPLGIAIDVAISEPPIAIHGRVTATRCLTPR